MFQRWQFRWRLYSLTILLGLASNALGQTGASISLGWTSSPDPRVAGYDLYYGAASQVYTNKLALGNVTNKTVSGLVPGVTYYFSITAADSLGNESPFCNQVSWLATSTSSGTTSNTPPTITSIANQTIDVNTSTLPLAFTIGDLETPTQLTLTASSSNPTLIPSANVIFAGSGANWTAVVTPALGQSGTATITLKLCDPSLCTTTSFAVIINPLPTITLTSPTSGATYTAPASVGLAASVTPNGHLITGVQFYNGSSLLGTALTSPYSLNWNSVPAGSYTLSAKALYDVGQSVASASKGIVVSAPPSLPAPWQTLDIGSVGATGSAVGSSGLYTVKGAGSLSGSADSFRFVYQNLSGDGQISAQITSLQNTSASAISGVMIRESLTSGSSYVMAEITPNGTIHWQRRNNTGSGTVSSTGVTEALPNIWLKLVRTGNNFYGYTSVNGTTWSSINSCGVNMAANIYIGFAVASGASTTLTTSTMTNVVVVP